METSSTNTDIDLTSTERIILLAPYWGQACTPFGGQDRTIDCNTILLSQVYLTPIEEITDDHCIELGKIFGHFEDRHNNTRLYVVMRVKKLLSGEDKHSPCSSIGVWADVLDFLRKHGYDVPYRGVSLFELGVAVKKVLN